MNPTGVRLARGFVPYLKPSSAQSTEKIKQICRHWLLMDKFKLHYDSQKNDDVVVMEFQENKFYGVFLLLGKTKYHTVCLAQMEKRYGEIDYGSL